MPNDKSLTLSIVIPVYNEQNHMKACLDAIVTQTVKPLEVIVVDNNSTDGSMAIAQKYNLVRILKEPIQGRTVSRNRGFNAARGDIIGRIDADSIVMPGWVERVLDDFSDSSIDGVAGLGQTRLLLGIGWLRSTFWSRAYFWTAQSLYGVITMWGANMAIRRSAWIRIKPDTAPDGSRVHEDQDLSLVLIGKGGKIIQDNKLLIRTEGISYLYWPKFWAYLKKSFGMKKYHKQLGTLKASNVHKISLSRRLSMGLLGWSLTGFSMIYSLICWPIIALRMRLNDNYGRINR